MSNWEKLIAVHPDVFEIWGKVWPIAVTATNSLEDVEEETHLNTVVQTPDEQGPKDIDTLNNPAGKLIGVFLAACPSLKPNDQPFEGDNPLRKMRDEIFSSEGRTLLIAQYRLVEALPYFLVADPDWTQEELVAPLIADNTEAITLWRAISRRTLFSNVLKIIGKSMAERAVDKRLGRKSRRSLVFSLVIESLHAFRENREPAVLNSRVQQMLRSLDDEVRTYGAEAVQIFVRDLSKSRDEEEDVPTPEYLFREAAKPFLEQVWPQERSLATPGASKAFADLPATTGDAFAEAVEAIERFLVPFDCWSMIDYGLYGSVDDKLKLSRINNKEKASAFLRLLDLTIGTSEGAIIPYELADALAQIREVEPRLAEDRVFRRLAAATRRG